VADPHFDLIVIGAGPAGEKAAAQAAYFGKSVAVIESEPEPGGAAVHTGTLPSKTLRETALYLSGHRNRQLYGVAVELAPDATVRRLIERKDTIAASASATIRRNLERHSIAYYRGRGRFADAHTIEIEDDGTRLCGDYILIASGSRPFRPADINFNDHAISDSDEILAIDHLPRDLTILGGGVIGCEYACMFAALGVKVTLVDARPEILPFLDLELIARLRQSMVALGIRLVQDVKWTSVARSGGIIATTLSSGERLETERLLFTAGRVGNTEGLGLDRIGVTPNARGYLEVDEAYRTTVSHVMAAGDVIGFPALASVSMEQGRVAICRAFGFAYKSAVSQLMPYGIYTIPEVSAVGETEESAREKNIDVVVGRALYRNNARGQITGDCEGMTKLVVARATRKVIGAHAIGERATELVHIGQTAIHMEAPVDLFIDMVFNYPTLAESYKYAAYECLAALNTAP